jgi:glyoxylate reductase
LERAARDYDARINHADEVYGSDELIARAEGCDAIVTCSTEKYSADVIERLPASVRAVATFSVGIEHFDLEAAKKRGLVMTNTPDVLTDSTADITMLVLLGAARRAYEGQQMVRANEWVGWNPNQLLGVHVSGKKLGVLGMGRIGRAVARRARGFDMEIHYHNRSRLFDTVLSTYNMAQTWRKAAAKPEYPRSHSGDPYAHDADSAGHPQAARRRFGTGGARLRRPHQPRR